MPLQPYLLPGLRDTINQAFGDPEAEGYHIQPLGQPHNGPNVPENVIIFGLNHHACFPENTLTYGKRYSKLDKKRQDKL